MSVIIFDPAAFRVQFPAFANITTFPDITLQAYFDAGTCYVSDQNYGRLTDACRVLALNLMTAHLTALSVIIAAGQTPALVQSSGIDKINVSLTPPPLKNQWQWWLSTTPYGAQLFALLTVRAAGGFYYGGLPERSAIRKVGGVF